MNIRHGFLFFAAMIFGIFVMIQAQSFKDVSTLIARDATANVFREIQILKATNENLSDEIARLEETLQKTSDRATTLKTIEQEILLNRMLTGEIEVEGPGVKIEIPSKLSPIFLVDLLNELFNAGAESVQINGLRATDETHGFDTAPSGQMLLAGNLIAEPFTIEAIGDPVTLENILIQPYGIVERMERLLKIDVRVERMERIVMKKVL